MQMGDTEHKRRLVFRRRYQILYKWALGSIHFNKKWGWHSLMGLFSKGSFSIKEDYNIKIRNRVEEDEIWEKIWSTNPWPKVATFCWLVVKWRLLMGENLRRRGIQGPSWCVLCANQEESMNHLLDTCPFTADLWDRGAQMFRKSNRCRGDPGQTIRD